MRAQWVVVLLCACGSKSKDVKPIKAPEVAKVETAAVLAKETARPPYIYFVEDAGVRIGAATTWAEIDALKLKVTTKPAPLREIDRYVREDFALDRHPLDTIKSVEDMVNDPVQLDLGSLEDETTRPDYSQDDPPPPEDEDKPDDGADESGGTGTAMALEEGKMGKKDSDRAEGQYKMRKNQDDPQLARQQAIEQARAAGILGGSQKAAGAPLERRPMGNEDGTPSRVAKFEGAVVPDGKIERLRAMIVIAPTLPATKLVEAIEETGAAIAVTHGGKIRPLNVDFGFHAMHEGSPYWVEARVTNKDISVEGVPDAPVTTDVKDLAAALDKVRKARGVEGNAPVDVLVAPDVNVQRLIDVIVALDVAGVRLIGLGPLPSADDLALRGHRIPTTTLEAPNVQGDLDKALIRRYVRMRAKPAIHECYAKALAKTPDLSGTIQVQFFISPKGKVTEASASGVDDDLAKCIAGVIKKVEFPEPNGGGGVQVNYPFTLRP